MHGPHEGARGTESRPSDEAMPGDGPGGTHGPGQGVTPQQWAIEALARVAPPAPRVSL